MAARISCSSICDGAIATLSDSEEPPIITGTKEAATADGVPAELSTPTTDVLKCSCGCKLSDGEEA